MSKFIRNEMLLTKEVCDKLASLNVLVVGCGGVGGYAIESLARLGVKNLTLVDYDVVEESNFNRQIIASDNTLKMKKVDAFKERILSVNAEAHIDCKCVLYGEETRDFIFDKEYDFVIDAIDTLSLKWDLIKTCLDKNIKFISSMGMGNKIDLTKIEITTLDKTINDPVSKKMREFARKDKINLKKIPVVFSSELPFKNSEGRSPSSVIFTPSVAGLLMGQYILMKTMNE